MDFPLESILVAKPLQLRDINFYPYCVVLTLIPSPSFKIYSRDYLKKNKELLEKFNKMNWEIILNDNFYFNLLKQKLISVLESEVAFPKGIEFLEMPSLVLKGELPRFPMSVSIFSLSAYGKFVFSKDRVIEKKKGNLHFNNGMFIYTRTKGTSIISNATISDYSDDSENENS